MSGKGSAPRPYSVDLKTFDNNWDNIFRRPDPRTVEDQQNEDEAFDSIVNTYNDERLVSKFDKQALEEIRINSEGKMEHFREGTWEPTTFKDQ